MRGKFFFVVLGLFFIYSCASGTLEVNNSTGQKLELEIRRDQADLNELMVIQNGETQKKRIPLKQLSGRTIFMVSLEMTVNLYARGINVYEGKDEIDAITLTDGQTTSVEIVSNVKPPPDERLVGKWENSDGDYFLFKDSNKCEIRHKSWNKYNIQFFEWKIYNGKIETIEWVEIFIKGRKQTRRETWDYINFVGSSVIKIGSTEYTKK